MKLLSRGLANQTTVLMICLTASLVIVNGQEVTSSETPQSTALTRSKETSDYVKPKNTNPVKEVQNNQQLDSDQTKANQTTSQTYVFPTKRERFNRYIFSMVGPFALVRTAVSAGIEQWNGEPVEWGQGASGYGKHYASSLGRNAIHQTVTYGLDVTMGLDTGFERSKRKGFLPRMKDALAENVTSRTKTGRRVISVPRLAGVYSGGIIAAETWYPSRYDYKDGLRNGTYSLASGFGVNLIREFLVHW
jgi:hypothetical protein